MKAKTNSMNYRPALVVSTAIDLLKVSYRRVQRINMPRTTAGLHIMRRSQHMCERCRQDVVFSCRRNYSRSFFFSYFHDNYKEIHSIWKESHWSIFFFYLVTNTNFHIPETWYHCFTDPRSIHTTFVYTFR